MENTFRSKTLTTSLPGDPRTTFDWIVDPRHLPRWYGSRARSGTIRFIREDRAHLLDLVLKVGGVEQSVAIRVLPNGDGSEIVVTLVQPSGLPDGDFDEQVSGAESALAELKALLDGQPAASPWIEPLTPEFPPAPRSGRKLYVGNLPFAWTEDQLRELFAAQGTLLSVRIARLRPDRSGRGRSRGFGFVEMSTEAEAQTAIEKLHEALAGDRKMVVRLARDQESKPDSPRPPEAAAPVRRTPSRPARGRDRLPARLPRAPSAASRDRSPAPRPPRKTEISNNSGYEIYPRTREGGFASSATPRRVAPRSTSPEPSPYMEDTGDLENRGRRPPRRRRR